MTASSAAAPKKKSKDRGGAGEGGIEEGSTPENTAAPENVCARDAEEIRRCIRVRDILEALQRHVIDGAEMSSTQVSAALALLKKTLPDLGGSSGITSAAAGSAHEEALDELE